MTTVNMRERRTWWGGKRFEMDDTTEKPKTFREREEEATMRFFFKWLGWSSLPALIVGGLYLATPYEGSAVPYPWISLFMAGAVLLIANLPNYAIMIIRMLALWAATYGRD